MSHTEIKQSPLAGNAVAINDVKLGLLKRRSNLVFHNFYPGAISDSYITVFDRGNAAGAGASLAIHASLLPPDLFP